MPSEGAQRFPILVAKRWQEHRYNEKEIQIQTFSVFEN